MRHVLGTSLLTILLALCCLPSVADVIHLEDGGRIVGKIVSESAREVTIESRYGGVRKVRRDEIESIERREEPEAPPKRKKKKKKKPKKAQPVAAPAEGDAKKATPKPAKWTSKETTRFKELVERVFATSKRAERLAVFEEASSLPPPPKSKLKKLMKIVFRKAVLGPRSERGIAGKRTLAAPGFPGQYLVVGEGKGPRALLIGLHGGGAGSGDGAISAQKWSFASGRAVCAFPTVLEKLAVAWNRDDNEQYVVELIQTLRRTYDIDSNRVYLVGHSMGGFGTWSIGGHHADLFAAISPNAGGLFAPALLPNLRNTPVYFYHSLDDKQVPPGQDQASAKKLKALAEEHGGYEYVYKEYNGIGHGLPTDGLAPIVDWLFTHTRDPYPKKIVFEPRGTKRTLYWLKSAEVGGRIVAEWKGNTVEIEGPGADYTVFVNAKLANLKEEVVVRVNGKERFRGLVPYSASALLESIAEKADVNLFFTGRIDIR
jgi:pimeloyl-ACP methyl ester carboxylesterase